MVVTRFDQKPDTKVISGLTKDECSQIRILKIQFLTQNDSPPPPALRLLANRTFTEKGIVPPEFIGRRPDCVKFITDGLRERGIIYKETIEKIES